MRKGCEECVSLNLLFLWIIFVGWGSFCTSSSLLPKWKNDFLIWCVGSATPMAAKRQIWVVAIGLGAPVVASSCAVTSQPAEGCPMEASWSDDHFYDFTLRNIDQCDIARVSADELGSFIFVEYYRRKSRFLPHAPTHSHP